MGLLLWRRSASIERPSKIGPVAIEIAASVKGEAPHDMPDQTLRQPDRIGVGNHRDGPNNVTPRIGLVEQADQLLQRQKARPFVGV